jgi:hypothetical protein
MIAEQSSGAIVAISIDRFGCQNESGPEFVRDHAMHKLGFAFAAVSLDPERYLLSQAAI